MFDWARELQCKFKIQQKMFNMIKKNMSDRPQEKHSQYLNEVKCNFWTPIITGKWKEPNGTMGCVLYSGDIHGYSDTALKIRLDYIVRVYYLKRGWNRKRCCNEQ